MSDTETGATGHRTEPAVPSSRAGWLVGLLLLGAVVAVVVRVGEGRALLSVLARADARWLLVGVGLQIVAFVCTGGILGRVLAQAGFGARLSLTTRLVLAKQFTDQAVPTMGIGGTLLVIGGLSRRGVPIPVATAAVLVELITYYAAFLGCLAFALGRLGLGYGTDPMILGAAALFGAMGTGVPLALLWLNARRARLPRWIARVPLLGRFLDAVAAAPPQLVRAPRLLAPGLALSLAVFALDALTLAVTLRAVGVDVPVADALTTFVLSLLAASVGMVPGGLGTFEAASVGVLSLLGVPVEQALAATLLLRGFTFWLPMAPGAVFARQTLRAGG